ncbi:response regulator [Kaarinaea lacus]
MLNLDTHQRFLLLSLIPLTTIAVVLGLFFISNQMVGMDESLNNRGHSIARHLASASAHGVISRNTKFIRPVVESVLAEKDVEAITIVNSDGSVLFRSNVKSAEDKIKKSPILKHKDHLIFMEPIFSTSASATALSTSKSTNNSNTLQTTEKVVGWAIVELSQSLTRSQQYYWLIDSIALTAILLFISFAMIYRISKRITTPIVKITDAANAIEKGNLEVEINTGASGELLILERSIKKMATSLKKSKQELQKEIDQATTDLLTSIQVMERQNKELASARQQALMASKVKSEFLANMSHEIRTPMNGILGFVKLLRKTNPSAEQLEHIETIEKSADNLLTIINDILDISKIEAGKVRLQNIDYNLRDCIEDVISLLAPSAYDKQLNLVSMFYSDVPLYLHGDVAKIRQILTNLVSNAIKFTDHGDIVIRSMLENEDRTNATIKISVTDTGIGISSKDQHRLFSTFEQVDSSSTRKYGGTGLGLAISKSLAELMQGDIGFSSELHQGSTFWFKFVHSHSAEIKPDLKSYEQLPSLSGKQALFYETNHASRLAISHLLEEWQIQVDYCGNTEELSNKLHTGQSASTYDFIILSLSYEELEPSVFTKILKTISEHNHNRIVCILNSIDAELLANFRNHGVHATIPKPPRYREFQLTLQALLDPHSVIAKSQDLSPEAVTINTRQSTTAVGNALNNATASKGILSGLNILVAEDNEINAKLVEKFLSQAGAVISVVNNGQKAIEAFEKTPFDIILMDIHMPEVNGVEVTKHIRQSDAANNNIPIIALTADAMPEDRAVFMHAGMNEVIIKPVNEEHLITKILEFTHTNSGIEKEILAKPKSSKTANNKNAKFAEEMYQLLIKELPDFKQNIQNSLRQKEFSDLFHHVHKLHGAVSYCDLPKLKSLLKQIETLLKKNQTEKIEAITVELFHNLDEMLSAT